MLAWGLAGAREQTLRLAAGFSELRASAPSSPGEHHPVWILGHLLLADSYLLTLLGAGDLPPDFQDLLRRYGPGSDAVASPNHDDLLNLLIKRLSETGERRQATLASMSRDDLARPTPDATLARAQPTLGHHLQALVFHEGYHAGQLAAWRRRHGLPAVEWAFAARAE